MAASFLAEPDRQSRPARRDELAVVLAITALGVLLRLYRLGLRSLWNDEALAVLYALQPWRSFWRVLWDRELNMGFYYLLLREWLRFSHTEVSIRMLSVILGSLTLPAIYLLGRQLFNARIGAIAMLLLSLHSFHVFYSQEARSYALLVLLLILSGYAFAQAVLLPKARLWWSAYLLVSTLALYTHFFAIFVLLAQWLSLGPREWKKIGINRAAIVLFSLLVLSGPMVLFLATKNQGQIKWVTVPAWHDIRNALKMLAGDAGVAPVLIYLGLILALISMYIRNHSNFSERFVLTTLLFPFLFVLFLSYFWRPLFYERFLVICLPALLLAAACAMDAITERFRYRVAKPLSLATLASVLICFSIVGLRRHYLNIERWPAFRDAVLWADANRAPDDVVMFYPPQYPSFIYYHYVRYSAAPWNSISHLLDAKKTLLGPAGPGFPGLRRTWMLTYVPAGQEKQTAAPAYRNLQLVQSRSFPCFEFGYTQLPCQLSGFLYGSTSNNTRR
jgi:uncharacterized membrane protein